MANIHNSGTFPNLMKPYLNRVISLSYERAPEILGQFFHKIKSEKEHEIFASLYGLGYLQSVSEGADHSVDMMGEAYKVTITPTEYSSGLIFTHRSIINNLYQKDMLDKGAKLGQAAASTREIILADAFNLAFTSTEAGGDGKELCATDHPNRSLAGVSSNEMATPAALSEAALEQIDKEIMAINDYRGMRANIQAQTLLIPNVLKYDAHRILQSNLRVGTTDNDPNALKAMGLIKNCVESKYLTSATKYFIITDVPVADGLVLVDREGIETEQYRDSSTRNTIHSIWVNFGRGHIDYNKVFGVAVA